ncbi:MAG: GyrI-like domain-containing protein [candidate division Zixibacteria bacterium]|nr:GyrI-like domain-containing protein [candidate division Zixibacteria bacterium]
MKPEIKQREKIILVGMDFFGDPFGKECGRHDQNAIGVLWQRFNGYYEEHKNSIKHQKSEAGYELWVDFKSEKSTKNEYIFVGVEVTKIDDLPLELVAKIIPEAKYAVFTLKGDEFKSDWSSNIYKEWLPKAGLTPLNFMIEYYDSKRFKGMNDPESELDIYVAIK